jgi:hypothetical protein
MVGDTMCDVNANLSEAAQLDFKEVEDDMQKGKSVDESKWWPDEAIEMISHLKSLDYRQRNHKEGYDLEKKFANETYSDETGEAVQQRIRKGI